MVATVTTFAPIRFCMVYFIFFVTTLFVVDGHLCKLVIAWLSRVQFALFFLFAPPLSAAHVHHCGLTLGSRAMCYLCFLQLHRYIIFLVNAVGQYIFQVPIIILFSTFIFVCALCCFLLHINIYIFISYGFCHN